MRFDSGRPSFLPPGAQPERVASGLDDQRVEATDTPDGELLAYMRLDGSNYYVARHDIAARSELRIGRNPSSKPTWSPDGRYIAYIVLPSEFSESPALEISTMDGQCKFRTSLVSVDRPRWYG